MEHRKRYEKLSKKYTHIWEGNPSFRGYLDKVSIRLLQPCENLPSLNMDEHCKSKLISLIFQPIFRCVLYFEDEIKIDATDRPRDGMIVSNSIWGILRGLESFSQLIYTSQNGIAVSSKNDLFYWKRND